jgi:hypothetical protein
VAQYLVTVVDREQLTVQCHGTTFTYCSYCEQYSLQCFFDRICLRSHVQISQRPSETECKASWIADIANDVDGTSMPRGQKCLELVDLLESLTPKISECGIGKASVAPAMQGSFAADDGTFSEGDFKVMVSTWSNVEDESMVLKHLLKTKLKN